MKYKTERIVYLLLRAQRHNLSVEEQTELGIWLDSHPYGKIVYKRLQEKDKLQDDIRQMQTFNIEKGWRKFQLNTLESEQQKPIKIVNIWKKTIWWGAAAMLMIVTLGVYRFWSEREKTAEFAVSSLTSEDILPGKNGALLTLSDGQTVLLDTVSDGKILLEGGISATVIAGQLKYDADNTTIAYNTVSTPNGRQFQLILADGTKVWLNSGSSIHFPTKFNSPKRIVQISGEVYFEVASNKNQPFVVETPQLMDIEVLGTHFNINSYDNEEAAHTTLLEGAVNIRYKDKTKLLTPGSQARVYPQHKNSEIVLIKDVNIEQVIAWKNGLFNFEGTDLQEVMKQLERWYDIEVQYEGKIPDTHFFGEISREEKLSDVLEALKESGIKFKIEKERRLIVLPK